MLVRKAKNKQEGTGLSHMMKLVEMVCKVIIFKYFESREFESQKVGEKCRKISDRKNKSNLGLY